MNIIFGLIILFAPCLAWGIDLGILLAEDEDIGFQASIGKSIYLHASYDTTKNRILGQPMGDVDFLGYGIGVRKTWDDVSVFIEYGKYKVSTSGIKPVVQHEVVIRTLVNDFGEPPFNPEETNYDLDSGYGARIGVGYKIRPHIKITAGYRFLKLDEHIDTWEGSGGHPVFDDNCGCLWQETNLRSFDTFQLGILVTW